MQSLIEAALAKGNSTTPAHLQKFQNVESPDDMELEELVKGLQLSIKVVGCGGGGCNTVTRLMEEGVVGAELLAANTDARHLVNVHAHRKVLIGRHRTRGLGAGGNPAQGEASAQEADEELRGLIKGAHIVFVTAGMGGGTGTGSAPYVAHIAKQEGALVISFVTTPFHGEGRQRMSTAQAGVAKLAGIADTVVVLNNDKLLQVSPKLPLNDAFRVLDELLMNSIKALIELITKPGLVNVDYNDLRTIMSGGGVSVMGLASTDETSNRAEAAVNELFGSPFLEYDISRASGALIKVTGGPDLTLSEAQKVAELLQTRINPNARIIWGAGIEPDMSGQLRVMMVVTGVDGSGLTGSSVAPRAQAGGKSFGLDVMQ